MEPDESVAATLEATADRAAKRGHPEIAAELAEHAARLTPARARRTTGPTRPEGWRRSITWPGTLREAVTSSSELIEGLPPSHERARALRLLGWFVDDIPRCTAILEQALGETGEDLELRSQVLSMLSAKECWGGRWATASRHLREAIEFAERSVGGAPLATARARLAWAEVGPDRLSEIERAVELERSLPDLLTFPDSPTLLHGVVLLAVDRFDDARRLLEESYERGLALGQSYRLVQLGWLADLELRAGNWERALVHARGFRGARSTVRR